MEHTAKIAGVNLQNAALCTTAGLREQFPCDGLPQFAFSGRSNVGKSSLINTLLGRKKLARVSSEPMPCPSYFSGTSVCVRTMNPCALMYSIMARSPPRSNSYRFSAALSISSCFFSIILSFRCRLCFFKYRA